MKRLTEHDDQGNWCLKDVAWSLLHIGQVITKEIWEKLYGALWKLKDYEDTGLTPEEIMELKEFCSNPLNTAVPAMKMPQWIPVEERLPENEKAVLATVRHRRWISDYDRDKSEWDEYPEYYEVCEIYRDGDKYVKMEDVDYSMVTHIPVGEQESNLGYPIEEVIAWMPLPEPYRD